MDEFAEIFGDALPEFLCNVCGEKEYELREGYYYCTECGTVAEQVRLVEVEAIQDHENRRFAGTKKIKKSETDELDLTSWECYNFILRGLVNDLINMGAKEELKLMTLQIWAAYLRRLEVAFFNRKRAELPHLGVRYLQKDAHLLYNHMKFVKKRRANSRANSQNSNNSDTTTQRAYRKRMRKLDESTYSAASNTDTSLQSSFNSSSTGRTSRAIQIELTNAAKKYCKKKMSKKHIQNHTSDAEGSMNCHSIRLKAKDVNTLTNKIQTLNIKQLYGILGIALNLIEDDIQLCDLVRFIAEDQITMKNVCNYFPENLQPKIDKILNSISFYNFPQKYSYTLLQGHMTELAKFLNISKFKMPNIAALVERYIIELNLPKFLTIFIDRLINLLPPSKCVRSSEMYAPYEARAMAYIIFAMKLLFGLDDVKEQRISQSAQALNKHLNMLSTSDQLHPHLFVWNEWVEYIEMRKILLCKYTMNFSEQFNQSQTTTQFLKEMQKQSVDGKDLEFDSNATDMKNMNLQSIFECLGTKLTTTPETTEMPILNLQPSLTPAHIGFQRILHNMKADSDAAGNDDLNRLPTFMHIDHSVRSVEPFVSEKKLKKFLKKHCTQLNVKPLDCNAEREFIGTFHVPIHYPDSKRKRVSVFQADFNIGEQQWREETVKNNFVATNLKFDTEFKKRSRSALSIMNKKYKHFMSNDITINVNRNGTEKQEKINKKLSIEVFNENDMNPLTGIELKEPRKNLNPVNIFNDGDTTDDDTENREVVTNGQENFTTMTLHTSSMDYWQILGYCSTINDLQKRELSSKFPLSFFWLLETCAQTLGVDWIIIYEQLLVLEVMFGHGLQNLNDFTDCLRYKYNLPTKHLNELLSNFRTNW